MVEFVDVMLDQMVFGAEFQCHSENPQGIIFEDVGFTEGVIS